MVASSFLGLSNRVTIMLVSLLSLESSFKSVCESEKKATSVPDINAELIKRKIRAIAFMPVIKSIDESSNINGSGSGSNCMVFD